MWNSGTYQRDHMSVLCIMVLSSQITSVVCLYHIIFNVFKSYGDWSQYVNVNIYRVAHREIYQ